MTDIISFQEGREARIDGKPRDGRRNADWLHGWDTVDMQERLSQQSDLAPKAITERSMGDTTRPDWESAVAETNRLQRELDITNADHIALWLEANTISDEPMSQCISWLACRIVEAHERALAAGRLPTPEPHHD